ncbi:hypothetical protein NP233_g9813 [Leucocoprinus birnbaumii]|uniref:ATP-dependent DNA helicase n=1 Tax=Leucocoprinus birnbaumii TaxID=56174 RepID=A0AAD5VLG4_9AGAR|nr:hypothetical protein NP233_g9813 [Leucocoprinus birnbaumii]
MDDALRDGIHVNPDVDLDPDFMLIVPEDVIKDAMRNFLNRTGNDALKVVPCCVCVRQTHMEDLEVFESALLIPNHQYLIPITSHSRHILFDGMLLHGDVAPGKDVPVCRECLMKLKNNKRLPLALSNNMWIGDVPFELRVLTLAKRLLVVRYFPAAYIIKMYPRDPSVRYWDSNSLNSGLKGNVSTYPLDTAEIAMYVNQLIMPPSTSIYSATIGITFVGPHGYPERTLPDILKVRRARVRDALFWLRQNNPLYAEIEISEERLMALPEDGVPDEIQAIAKYSEDIEAVYKEHESYVPEYETEEDTIGQTQGSGDRIGEEPSHAISGVLDVMDDDIMDQDDFIENNSQGALGVVPFISHGVIDATGYCIPDKELMAHALANTARNISAMHDLKIRRGSAFINEYARQDPITGERSDGGPTNPNHLLGSFLWLFPYGMGGFEVDREIDVPYETHIRWALLYVDRRFRLDLRFVFQVFGVMQKRAICRAATIHIGQPTFQRHRSAIMSLTEADFLQASQEEMSRYDLSNPTMRELRKELSTVRVQIAGMDESRVAIRRKIWGATVVNGPPSIWLTINPSDTHDPIVQVMVGEDIDLDQFDCTAGPSSSERARNVAKDPFAAAKFFHWVIVVLLEDVFGIKGAKGASHVRRRPGLLGTIRAYVGTVEAQFRGTLHFHSILWLKGAPSAGEINLLLKSEWFREKVRLFIDAHIHGDVDNLDAITFHNLPRQNDASYSRPLDPDDPDFEEKYKERERILARSVQYHQCTTSTCLRNIRGRLQCKCRAPFEVSSRSWIASDGRWGPKRHSAYLNNFNRWLLQLCCANHDIKLITNGEETRNIGWYITNYTAKKQKGSGNASALLAKRFAFHQAQEYLNTDSHQIHKRLIERCANTLSREQEFSAPEVISYLMGWGDRYISHYYAKIYWDAARDALTRAYPQLKPEYATQEREGIHTIQMQDGIIRVNDQLGDYMARGEGLEGYSFFDFVVETYDGRWIADEDNSTRRGRRPNERVRYRGDERAGRCRVLRSEGHETLPEFIGKWLPRSNNEDDMELYSASMLLLFKPWQEWQDIPNGRPSFEEEFALFFSLALFRIRQMLENIQYYYDSMDSTCNGTDVNQIGWKKELESITRNELQGTFLPSPQIPDIPVIDSTTGPSIIPTNSPGDRTRSIRPKLSLLNEDQRRAHDIIEDNLLAKLNGSSPPQLLMCCFREGGTGKTTLINAITRTFQEHGAEAMLAKTATSGVAATLIGGETLHFWLGASINMPKSDNWMENSLDKAKIKRSRNISNKHMLFIDECSMLTLELLGLAEEIISSTRIKDGCGEQHQAFGGLNIVLFGDFHQFPPVSRSRLALYLPTTFTKWALIGHELYRRFEHVVILKTQNRVKDERWMNLLRNLREGACTSNDITLLESLQLTNPRVEIPDFTTSPWNEAILVTSWRVVKDMWNQAALQRHSMSTGNAIFVSPSEDRVLSGREARTPTLEERVVIAKLPTDKSGRLADIVEISIGMRTMVLLNISIEADLANGTKGIIEDIVLDPREPDDLELDEKGRIILQYPPSLVKFRPDNPPTIQFAGLGNGLIPISPSQKNFSAQFDTGLKFNIQRKQLALTQAYAFTDYKSQGQTLPAVIVDLAPPPGRGGKLTPFNAYVALSRSRGRDTIRILRHFDEALFTNHPSDPLREEDKRLEALAEKTKRDYIRRVG